MDPNPRMAGSMDVPTGIRPAPGAVLFISHVQGHSAEPHCS